jgi:hypothetical protein
MSKIREKKKEKEEKKHKRKKRKKRKTNASTPHHFFSLHQLHCSTCEPPLFCIIATTAL